MPLLLFFKKKIKNFTKATKMEYTILGQIIEMTENDFNQLATSFAEIKNWPIKQAELYIQKRREYIFLVDRQIIETWLKAYQFGSFAKGMPKFNIENATLEALQSSCLTGIEDE